MGRSALNIRASPIRSTMPGSRPARPPAIREIADASGGDTEGFARSQYTIRNGRRSSAATAYLKPVLKRKNLTVKTRVLTTKVMLEGTRATGVEYVERGKSGAGARRPRSDSLRRRVQLAATSDAVRHRPGAASARDWHHAGGRSSGRNKFAGPSWPRRSSMRARSRDCFTDLMRFDRMAVNMLRAYFLGTGPATTIPSGVLAFIKTRPELAVPDVEYMFPGSPPYAHLWFPGVKARLRRCLRHSPGDHASGQPRQGVAALRRSARSAAHHLQLLFGAERSADLARRLQARPRHRDAESRWTNFAATRLRRGRRSSRMRTSTPISAGRR